jgi:hypothetical protein
MARKKRLTAEELASKGATTCPFCGKEEVEGYSIEIGLTEAYQECACGACNKEWRTIYHLAGYNDGDRDRELPKYAEIVEKLRIAREGLEKALDGLESASHYFDKEDSPRTVRAVGKALREARKSLRKTKPNGLLLVGRGA